MVGWWCCCSCLATGGDPYDGEEGKASEEGEARVLLDLRVG